MESYTILAEAARYGVPAVAVRAISDTADFDMPYDFESARDARGQIRIGGVLAQVLRRPSGLPALFTLARDCRTRFPASCRFPGYVRGNACRPADSHRAGYGGGTMSQSGTILETSFAAPPVPATMRAAVYRGKGRVVVEDVPVPAIGAGKC